MIPHERQAILDGLTDALANEIWNPKRSGHSIRSAIEAFVDGVREATTERLSLHRCKVCGTYWLWWPDYAGGIWNLLDGHQRPGECCDNAPMGDQIELIRALAGRETPAPTPSLWQPIASAPKDGTGVLVFARKFGVSYYGYCRWESFDDGSSGWIGGSFESKPVGNWTAFLEPILWHPLPDPPAVAALTPRDEDR